MLSEIDGQISRPAPPGDPARRGRRPAPRAMAAQQKTEASASSGRRLPAIVRRLVGAPTFA